MSASAFFGGLPLHVLFWTQTEDKNGGGLGTRLSLLSQLLLMGDRESTFSCLWKFGMTQADTRFGRILTWDFDTT